MEYLIQEMTAQDYEGVLALWKASQGVGLSDADSPEGIATFLARNPGLSFVALRDRRVVGAALCGHDGRRGYLHHLAVHPSCRREGLGRSLVEGCLAVLGSAKIQKCHIFVYAENTEAITFWKEVGWSQRVELVMMSKVLD
jgi:putative acetyltransferase